MSVTSRNPLRIAGAVVNSGFANTAETRQTRGGEAVFWSASGIGADVVIFSGAGRLNSVTRLSQLSGAAVKFYDGVPIATSGGPFSTSGHKLLYTLQQDVLVPAIGSPNVPQLVYGLPYQVDMPFLSGLLAAVVASGSFSWNVSYSPETNLPNPG